MATSGVIEVEELPRRGRTMRWLGWEHDLPALRELVGSASLLGEGGDGQHSVIVRDERGFGFIVEPGRWIVAGADGSIKIVTDETFPTRYAAVAAPRDPLELVARTWSPTDGEPPEWVPSALADKCGLRDAVVSWGEGDAVLVVGLRGGVVSTESPATSGRAPSRRVGVDAASGVWDGETYVPRSLPVRVARWDLDDAPGSVIAVGSLLEGLGVEAESVGRGCLRLRSGRQVATLDPGDYAVRANQTWFVVSASHLERTYQPAILPVTVAPGGEVSPIVRLESVLVGTPDRPRLASAVAWRGEEADRLAILRILARAPGPVRADVRVGGLGDGLLAVKTGERVEFVAQGSWVLVDDATGAWGVFEDADLAQKWRRVSPSAAATPDPARAEGVLDLAPRDRGPERDSMTSPVRALRWTGTETCLRLAASLARQGGPAARVYVEAGRLIVDTGVGSTVQVLLDCWLVCREGSWAAYTTVELARYFHLPKSEE